MRRALCCLMLVSCVIVASTGVESAQAVRPRFAPAVTPPSATATWLATVNTARQAVGSPLIAESSFLSDAAKQAALCLSRNGQEGNPHVLDPARSCGPGVSFPTASYGARNSDITLSSAPRSQREVLDSLLRAPFHAMAMLRPSVQSLGYGDAYNPASPLARNRFVGAVAIGTNTSSLRSPTASILVWPPSNWPSSGTFTTGSEYPSPLWGCGLTQSGPPLWFATPRASIPPVLTNLKLVGPNGATTPLCVFNSAGFTYPKDDAAAGIGRTYMNLLKATMVVPTLPLSSGSYTLSGSANGVAFSRQLLIGSGVVETPLAADTAQLSVQVEPLSTRHEVDVPAGASVAVDLTDTAGARAAFAAASVTTATGDVLPARAGSCGNGSNAPTYAPLGYSVPVDESGVACFISTTPGVLRVTTWGSLAPAGVKLLPQSTTRVVDTRTSGVMVSPGQPFRIPALTIGAGVAALTIFAVSPTETTRVSTHLCTEAAPTAGLDMPAGRVTSVSLLAQTDVAGDVCVSVTKALHIVVDTNGRSDVKGSRVELVVPREIASSRTKTAYTPRLGTVGSTLSPGFEYRISDLPGLPANTTGAILRVVTEGAVQSGTVRFDQCGSAGTGASLAFRAGQTSASAVIAPVTSTTICLVSSASVHVNVTLDGWLRP